MSDDLYRLIPEEGKHLADSRDTEGAVRGVYLDDKTNKPCGAGEFVPVDPSEFASSDDSDDYDENGISPESVAALIGIGVAIGALATKAYPHVKRFVSTKVAPPVKQFWNAKIKKKKAAGAIECKSENTNLSIEVVLQEYRENISSEEAKKELIDAFVLQVIAAKKIKRVAQSNIVGENGQITDGRELVEILSNPTLIAEINTILSANPQLLSQQQTVELSSFLGYDIVSKGTYIPFSSETIHDKLEELYI